MKIDLTEIDAISKKVETLGNDRVMRGRLVGRLGRGIADAAQAVVGSAVKHRFKGKGPFPVSEHRLGVRSNRLWRSIRATLPQVRESTGEVSISMGSDVKYFSAHEFGFEGKVKVRGHTRRKAKGDGATRVRGHTRQMKVPERAPLGTELRSERGRGEFWKAIKRAVDQTYKEVMA